MQLVLRAALLGLEGAALRARRLAQLVRLGLGHAQDLRGAPGGAGAHVVDLVLGHPDHLLQPVAHAVDGARDGGELGDLAGEPVHLGPGLGELGPRGAGLAAADVELAGDPLPVRHRVLARRVRAVALGEQLAEPFLDLRAVEAAADDRKGQAVEIRCHGAERSSWSEMSGCRPHGLVRMTSHEGERERAVDHTGRDSESGMRAVTDSHRWTAAHYARSGDVSWPERASPCLPSVTTASTTTLST